ncbi:hypothetical protein ACQEVB_03385 [Pseudonocardia sp. CA-107938]|uniref:hypothetical protein n=1 Tax=Pseudonocardia sp. CA-107938 TaxID=3240021 RepID=UPI003D8B1DB9
MSIFLFLAGTSPVSGPSGLWWIGPVLVVVAAAAVASFRLAAQVDMFPGEVYAGLAWLSTVVSSLGIVAVVLLVDPRDLAGYAVLCPS